ALATKLSVNGKREEASVLLDEAMAEALELRDVASRCRVLWSKGTMYWALARHKEAMEIMFEALSLIEEHGLRGKAAALHTIALVFSAIADHSKSLEYYEMALEHFRRDQNTGDEIGTTANIGLVYLRMDQVDKGLEILRNALDKAEAGEYSREAANIIGNIGFVYSLLKQLDLAEEYSRKAIDRATTLQMSREVGYYTTNLAQTMYQTGRKEEALKLLDERADIIAENSVPQMMSMMLRAEYAEEQGDLQGSLAIIAHQMTLCEERGDRDHQLEHSKALRDKAKKLGDFEAYVRYNELSMNLERELESSNVSRALAVRDKVQEFEAERQSRDEERQRLLQEREHERSILYSTLPRHVADRVLRGEQVTDHFEEATVLFLDVAGFTAISDRIPAGHVVHLLKAIFKVCDEACEKHGITKIKTIGDSYMAVAGVPESLDDHTARAALTALEMARGLNELELTMDPSLGDTSWTRDVGDINVRIGLHCGPVVAGIVGDKQLQYDVWGDTVNVASRMESSGEPLKIHISETFADCLQKHGTWNIAFRGETPVKGKGLMKTYWLGETL
ncbi:MAG: tetratricopeptide repeat protein, partial [Candidatus Kapabacteria bacterium]|nr:tetratricopeptide repeat protein [Candidatus Kapabacteria bacterium]